MNREIISGEIECKEGLNGKNKSLKKTIKCALTGEKGKREKRIKVMGRKGEKA